MKGKGGGSSTTALGRSHVAGWTTAILLALAATVGGYSLIPRRAQPVATEPEPTVTVSAPLERTVQEWDRYIGRFAPSQMVDLRPRVSGQISQIHFQDGASVERNQLLFTIDKRPFEAALAEAKASLASALSDLTLARAEADRGDRLSDVAITRSDLDRRRARLQSATATAEAAEARVRARALDLEFTEVRAPIAGRASDRRVDAGNLVTGGDGANATLLTTISAIDPIYFIFDASEGLFLKSKRAWQAGEAPTHVEVRLQDEDDYTRSGNLEFTDSGLDMKSGTIRLRASLGNPDHFLTPGMFGNMRLSNGGKSSVLLVPDASIVTEQSRKVVFTVARDGTVLPKPVEPGPLVDGLRVVRTGLQGDDQVVIAGTQVAARARRVQTKAGSIEPASAPRGPQRIQAADEVTFAR